MWCDEWLLILLGAALVDFAIGDPWNWLHPVQVIGWSIQIYQTSVLKHISSAFLQRLAGGVLGLGLPVLSGAIATGFVLQMRRFHPLLGLCSAIIVLASCFAGHSLRRAAEDVLWPLGQGNLQKARETLSLYVGRDTESLPRTEILRAVLETISENTTDGVTAPLFYALVGFAISPAIGVGLPIAYKALSTLDSMVGYRSIPYVYLGWFSARFEDIATWFPCRLTVLTIALFSGRPRHVWNTCCRDAPVDPSPNAGWSECAFAATLGVQLGGMNRYKGKLKEKPLLANSIYPITPPIIYQALALTRWIFLAWLMFGAIALGFRYRLHY